MELLDLFIEASMPILKYLILTTLGLLLALESVDIIGQSARKQVNNLVFYVFGPALVFSNLANTVTYDVLISLWFMPANILISYTIGTLLGWVLIIITRPPKHLKGLIVGASAAGNLGGLPLVIVPAVCKEKNSPFGDPDVCSEYALAYATLSLAIGGIFFWSYVYNLVRVLSGYSLDTDNKVPLPIKETESGTVYENLLPPSSSSDEKVTMKQYLVNLYRKINFKAIFAPSTTGAILGFIIGTISPIRRLMIGNTAPFRVIQDSASLLGDAAIPAKILIVGANLLKGLKGSGISLSHVFGIIVARYVFLPLSGILIVKGALHLGLVPRDDPLYLFVLLLQYALPPAMNIGTMTQLFGSGESECSVILLWAYGLASISLTLWSMLFIWIVS